MARIRATRRPVRLTFETLETRDMPSADLAAALPVTPPCPADPVLAAPARGSDTLDPGAQTLSARTQAGLQVVAPPNYNLDKAARLIAEKFNADFNQKNNIWGIESVRLTYYGIYDYKGRPVVDVRVELQIREPWPSQRLTWIDFHMNFDARENLADGRNVIFRLTRTEVWWRGQKTAAFVPLETAVHTAWHFSPPICPSAALPGPVRGPGRSRWHRGATGRRTRRRPPASRTCTGSPRRSCPLAPRRVPIWTPSSRARGRSEI